MNKKTLEVVGCMFKFAKNLAQEVGGGGGLGLGGGCQGNRKIYNWRNIGPAQKKKKKLEEQ